jgi:hypothetical protein
MNKLQAKRAAALAAQYGRLVEQRDDTIDKLTRIALKLKAIEKQLGRYERIKAGGGRKKGNTFSLTGFTMPPGDPSRALPENGDELDDI